MSCYLILLFLLLCGCVFTHKSLITITDKLIYAYIFLALFLFSALRKNVGMDYEAYLRMFLTLLPPETLAMRTLDVVEGELQRIDGCSRIHVDHCADRLTARIWFEDIYQERTYGYE